MTQVETALPWFIPTPEQVIERERILRSVYFLVRQDSELGERARCRRCNRKHTHLTLMCVEKPFSGVSGGLFAFWKAAGAHGGYDYLSPAARLKYDELTKKYGVMDLADGHPSTAEKLQIAPGDVDLGAIALGILEPLTKAEAQRRVWRINSLGCRPPLVLPGIRGGV